MNGSASGQETFVVFPLGTRRFALGAGDVVEISRSDRAQAFPHTTQGLSGVLVRRGEILPVWDLAGQVGQTVTARRFWLITRRNFAGDEPTAVPVSGECQMVRAAFEPPPAGAAEYVRGVLLLGEQSVEVLDLARLVRQLSAVEPGPRAGREEKD